MKRAADELAQVLNYEKLSGLPLLPPAKIEKADIPDYISCPKYDKAKAKIEQTMERYQEKVKRVAADIEQLEHSIAVMDKEQRKWAGKASTFMLDRSDARAVEKQNQAADNANRLLDQIASAHEKRNDLIDKHNAAIEEANEKLQELTQESLVVIDEDIVACLDRCTRIVDKLCGSQNTEDLVSAAEICLIELKIHASFEDHIESNVARKDSRDRIAEAYRHFAALCENGHVRNYFGDLYRRNAHLIQQNADIYGQVGTALASVDQRKLEEMTKSVQAVLGETFDTKFAYEGVVDPAELEAVVVKIRNCIGEVNRSIARAKDLAATTEEPAKAAATTHQNAEDLLASMKANVEGMQHELLAQGHFACQMIDEAAIEDFFHRDLRAAVTGLRQHVVASVGEEQVDALVGSDEDRFALAKAENAIGQANLRRLQAEWDKIGAHVKTCSDLIAAAEEDIRKAGQVPQQNADALRAELGTKYGLACVPVIGVIFAAGIAGRLKTFEPAFRSANEIYRQLGSDLLAKNGKMTSTLMVLGGVLGGGGLIAFLALNLGGANAGVKFGVPVALLVLYGISVAILTSAGKRLRSTLEGSGGTVAVPVRGIDAGS